MSNAEESRYKGGLEIGGPESAIVRKLAWFGCWVASWWLEDSMNATSVWGGSYLSVPRKGTVFRSAKT